VRSHYRNASIEQGTVRRNPSLSTRRVLSAYPAAQGYDPGPSSAYSSPTRDEQEMMDDSEPTLSVMTSSTTDSSSSGPDPTFGVAYGGLSTGAYGDQDEKTGQRARTRTAAGRANAYSSAESSTASGFYTVNTYPSNSPLLQHPHPPPLPTRAYNDEVGLGITADDAQPARPVRTSSYNAGRSILYRRQSNQRASPTSPSNTQPPSVPWQESIANRLRSDSASSSASAASYSDGKGDTSASESDLDGRPERYPWEGDEDTEDEQDEAVAVSLVEKGRERILDQNRVRAMGGLEIIINEKISQLAGESRLEVSAQ
jgi:hypothetical protein